MTNSFQTDYATPPGETLAETIEAMGITQTELARRMGRPIKTVNEIIQGKAALTADTAIDLERVLGVPASLWNGLESGYREHLARQRAAERLEIDEEWLKRIPVKAMRDRRWIAGHDDKRLLTEELLGFFGCGSFQAWLNTWGRPEVAYRKSPKFESHPEALAAWLRKAEIEGRKQLCHEYSADAFEKALKRLRGMTRLSPPEWVVKIREECNACGVAYVVLPELHKTRVSGAARQITDTCPLIVQTGRYKDDGHFWFTFFHEARHVLQGKLRKEWLIEENSNDDPLEADANQFAREFLVPTQAIRTVRARHGGKMPAAAAEELADELGIAAGIVVGRLQFDGIWKQLFGNHLKRRYTVEELFSGLDPDTAQ